MHRTYQPLVVVLAAVCAGIVLDRQAGVALPVWFAAAACALLCWWLLWRKGRDRFAAALLAGSLLVIGGAWHHFRWHCFAADEIGLFAQESPEPVCIEAIATTGSRHVAQPAYDPLLPPNTKDKVRLGVRLVAIRDGCEWRTASGNALVIVEEDRADASPRGSAKASQKPKQSGKQKSKKPTTDNPAETISLAPARLPEIHAGDRLRIFGHLTGPSPAANPGEPDLAELARGRGEMALVRAKSPQCVSVLAASSGWSFARFIEAIRGRCDQLLWEYLPNDRAGLAAAVLFGAREELQSDRVENFLLTGSIHTLIVAGLHVGILAWLLFKALRFGLLPRRTALLAVMGLTGLYMLVTDAGPPVVRATILVWAVCGAMLLGRRRSALNTLAMAGLIVIALNPTDLFRMGTQLSFLCVAALIVFWPAWNRERAPADALDRLLAQSRPWPLRLLTRVNFELWQTTLAGLTMFAVSAPLAMARYHLFSPSAVLLNPLLIPPLSVAMIAGFGVLAFGAWLPPAAALCGWICDRSLGLLEWSVSHAATVPGSHFWVPGPREWWLAGFYLALAGVAYFGWLARPRWRTRAGVLVAAWCGVGFGVAWLLPAQRGGLDCTFVSVGHGCATVLELPGGRVLLSDAGRMGSPLGGARDISSYLWSRGLTHIDAIVLSHNDTDHFNAVPELLQRFSVGAVYVSPVMFNRQTRALDVLQQAVQRARVPMLEISDGDRLASGDDTQIDVLHPPPDGMGATENADSIVLAIRWRGWRFLMTGDLAPPGLETVVGKPCAAYDVAMVPHHGSATSSPATFAAWCRPHWAVISGDLAHDSHVAVAAYRAAGSEVLNTATSGAVHFGVSATGTQMRWDCFRRGDRW